ncbi:MAG: glycoside hydrolase family 26 protein, partial [bacterium]
MPMPARSTFRFLVVLALMATAVPAAASDRPEIQPLGHEILLTGVYSDQWVAGSDLVGIGVAGGEQISLTGTFHHLWESENGIDNTDHILEQAWAAQTTPVVNLEIMVRAAEIANGSYDAHIAQWASRVKSWTDKGGGRSLLIAPLQEMNGNWVPYGMDPGGFKAAYRRIVEISRGIGLDETKVRWVFAPNAWSVHPYHTADYYPGDDIVDFVGISVYNFGASVGRWTGIWDSGLAVLDELRGFAPYKPFLITQVGSSTSGGDRDSWLRDLFNAAAWDPNVVGLVYFNFNKETDWKVWDGVNVAAGWREGMNLETTVHIWPLRKWFQSGPLAFTPYSGRFADDDQLGIQNDVEWLADQGIVTGCTDRHFCPHQWVSREQMATFLVRALDLSPSEKDFFGDDTGSPHEANINAFAAAGFASGCGPDAFCPSVLVSRQQLADMLSPALSLTPSRTRQFGDFMGATRDPWGAVTRQEMVNILRIS